MAYANQSTPRSRAVSMGVVISIHAVALYVLVTGLAGEYIRHTDRPLPTTVIHTDPPKPPKPETRQPEHPTPQLPQPNPLPQTPFPHPTEMPMPMPTMAPTDPMPMPLPQPSPRHISFAPKDARALGNPASWVSAEDYPAADMREEHAGTTRFTLSISAGGQVSSCVVTRSSGWPGLDAVACQLITRRAHFAPATDDTGAHVAGSYAGAIRWEIPQ